MGEDSDAGVGEGFGADGFGEIPLFKRSPLGEAKEDVGGGSGSFVTQSRQQISGKGQGIYSEDALDL